MDKDPTGKGDPERTYPERTYRVEVTGVDGQSVTGRVRLAENEALALAGQELSLEDEEGRAIRGSIVGETPEQVVIERQGGEVLVKVVGHYV